MWSLSRPERLSDLLSHGLLSREIIEGGPPAEWLVELDALSPPEKIARTKEAAKDARKSSDGRLLIFEADTGMVVHDMDPVDLFPYKLPQMRRVFSAFQQAVRGRAQTRPA